MTPINRRKMIEEAILKCYKELYKMAQPSADLDELIRLAKEGKEDSKMPFYRQHYLSQENYVYICDMFMDAYNIKCPWEDHCDTVISYLENGGKKDKYIKPDNAPGYRGYEDTPKLSDVIGEENAKKAIDLIKECRGFYRLNSEENSFRFTVMDASPTTNKQEVIDYWKSQGKDVKIKDIDVDKIYYGDCD
jgi:hypothetical protein